MLSIASIMSASSLGSSFICCPSFLLMASLVALDAPLDGDSPRSRASVTSGMSEFGISPAERNAFMPGFRQSAVLPLGSSRGSPLAFFHSETLVGVDTFLAVVRLGVFLAGVFRAVLMIRGLPGL